MAKGPPRRKSLRTGPERDRMVEANLGLARKAARCFSRGDEQRYEEYLSPAYEGLSRAAELWDPRRRVPFSSYAYKAAVGMILRYRQLENREAGREPIDEHTIEAPFAVDAVSFEAREALERAIATMSPRMQLILRMRFGLGVGRSYLLAGIASRLGLSKERVRQLQEEALDKLREILPALHPGLFGAGFESYCE